MNLAFHHTEDDNFGLNYKKEEKSAVSLYEEYLTRAAQHQIQPLKIEESLNLQKKNLEHRNQLEFKISEPTQFTSEQPAPLIFEGASTGEKKTTKSKLKSKPNLQTYSGGLAKKQKSAKSLRSTHVKQFKSMSLSRPKSGFKSLMEKRKESNVKIKKNTDTNTNRKAQDWNFNGNKGDFFDKNLNTRTMDQIEREERAGGKKNKQKQFTNQNEQIDGRTIASVKTGGREKKIEIYRDINKLIKDKIQNAGHEYLKRNKSSSPGKGRKKSQERMKGQANMEIEKLLEDHNKPYLQKLKEKYSGNFSKQNQFIGILKDELAQEKVIRKEMDAEFEHKMNAMEQMKNHFHHEAIEVYKNLQEKLEEKENIALNIREKQDLDLIPTKEPSEPKSNRVTSKTPTLKSKTISGGKKKSVRFKASPPSTIYKSLKAPKTTSKTSPLKKGRIASPSQHKHSTNAQFMNKLHEHEIERQLVLDSKTEAALSQIDKFLYNPTSELNAVSQSLNNLQNNTLKPLLSEINDKITQMQRYDNLKEAIPSALNMISSLSARYIILHAEELTQLIMEDLLEDTVDELNQIQQTTEQELVAQNQHQIVHELYHQINTLYEDQEVFRLKIGMQNKNQCASNLVHKYPSGAYMSYAANRNRSAQNVVPPSRSRFVQFERDIGAERGGTLADKEMSSAGYSNPFLIPEGKGIQLQGRNQETVRMGLSLGEMPAVSPLEEEKSEAKGGKRKGSGKEVNFEREDKRQYYVNLNKTQMRRMEENRGEFKKHILMTNNSTNREVIKIYDFIAEDLSDELIQECANNYQDAYEEYIDSIIKNEFGIK